ncbi:hypothetical protein EV128_108219 [Rhizobium azibense]|nr:hypothetical protein EV128_108219 [Rhizobium azibense]
MTRFPLPFELPESQFLRRLIYFFIAGFGVPILLLCGALAINILAIVLSEIGSLAIVGELPLASLTVLERLAFVLVPLIVLGVAVLRR